MIDDVPPPTEPDNTPRRGFEDAPLQSFDIDHPEFDHVTIYRAETPDEEGREYYAVPFVFELHLPNSYNEPHEWEPDDTYREAVLEEALVPTDNLRLEPHPTVTTHLGGEPGL